MHAPSVGEGLMARPVLEAWRQRHPEWQVAFSFFSPSAEAFAATLVPSLADVSGVLPFDTARHAHAMLAALRPSLLCFAKLDLWPLLVAQAARDGVPVAMVSATVPAHSGRLHPVARAVLRDAYAALAGVGAVDEDSAARLTALGVPRARVTVTGDTRYDQVLARIAAMPPDAPWRRIFTDPRPTVVAGSTWPSDEAPLVAAWREVRAAVPAARLVVAPHEPTEAHLAPLAAAANREGWQVARLGAPDAPRAEVVLVDRVGVLAELYAVAQVALVGGGFHQAGLHSVVEPAALGLPVVCGPQDAEQRDAALLERAGALVRVSSAHALGAQVTTWLTSAAARGAAALAAREVVQREAGAGARSAALLEQLLRVPPPRPR
jgi:3-deoxy-D-manno-octulosonic-acid transferase